MILSKKRKGLNYLLYAPNIPLLFERSRHTRRDHDGVFVVQESERLAGVVSDVLSWRQGTWLDDS